MFVGMQEPRMPPSGDMVVHHVIVALVDILLTMPDLPPDLVSRLASLKRSGSFYERIQVARDISDICAQVHARLGRS
jgi:hypothetical protein